MKSDFLKWAERESADKVISKETLNHQGIIELASGLDVFENTPEAYLRAYGALGIDLINRVPDKNAGEEKAGEKSRFKDDYRFRELGVYGTAFREKYPLDDPGEVWEFGIEEYDYEDLITPVPHSCNAEDIKKREELTGDIGMYYPMLYTTVFMWAVEMLGWEVFMVTAIQQPDKFQEYFLRPVTEKSLTIIEETADASECPFVFLHDDLADANGPVFPPSWYEDNVFCHYEEMIELIKSKGKEAILVADGNMEQFLERLADLGFSGIMYENPATSVDAVTDVFGKDGFFIGGIDTAVLTNGGKDDIRKMVIELYEKCRGFQGFAISSCGGIHGNIPMENLIAYFDARAEIGATPTNWKKYF